MLARTFSRLTHPRHPPKHALFTGPLRRVASRDLKPSNIGLSEDGVLKVFDFGLARVREQRDPLTDRYVVSHNNKAFVVSPFMLPPAGFQLDELYSTLFLSSLSLVWS